MKERLFIKLIVVILVIVTLFSTAALTISAASDSIRVANNSESTAKDNPSECNYAENLKQINDKLDKITPKSGVKELWSAKTADKVTGTLIDSVFSIINESGDVNYKNVAMEAGASVVNLVASCFGFGGIAEAITGGLLEKFKDKSPTEIQLLQKHIDAQFEIVNQGIADIRNDISDLSKEMDDSLAAVVKDLEDAIEAQGAGEKVYAFTFSGLGNFDYTLFKNYIYGTSDSTNDLAAYAYYDKLARIIASGEASTEEIEEAYNALYRNLVTVGNERIPYISVMRQYIMDDEYGYSIQRYYYDWMASNQSVLNSTEKMAEWEAILFTLDVYRTMLGAEHCVWACDNYFLTQIYLEYGANPPSNAFYKYTSPDGYITYIKYTDLINEIENLNRTERDKALIDQVIKDIIYILNMENSYILESADGSLYTVNNVDASTFGQVRTGQTVYMNRLSDKVCEIFDLDPQKFTYVWADETGNIIEENSGMLDVPTDSSIFSATLYYDGTFLYSRTFTVNDDSAFCGGNGTESDPYLISTVEQFNKIEVGEKSYEVYYVIINDIDFSNVDRTPMGNKNTPFSGVLNGDGHTLKNLRVITGEDWECVGLFGKIGEDGAVRNLTLENATISGNDHARHTIFAGGIAGQNEGTIENCHLKDSLVKIYRYTTQGGSCPITYVGGIAGGCYGEINHCSLNSSSVEATSERKKGQGDVYLSGISGYLSADSFINNVAIENDCSIKGNSGDAAWLYSAGVYFVAKNDISDHSNIQKAYVAPDTALYVLFINCDDIGGEISDNVNRKLGINSRDDIVFPSCSYQPEFSYINENINSEYNYNESQIYIYDEDFLKTHIAYKSYKCTSEECDYKYQEQYGDTENGVSAEILFGDLPEDFKCPDCGAEKTSFQESVNDVTYKNLLELSVDSDDGFSLDSYTILGYYGLDTLSSDKIDGGEHIVTVIFEATLKKEGSEDKRVILSVDIPIVVEKIKPSELVIVEKPKTQYSNIGDLITLDGGKFELHWEDGSIDQDITPEIVSNKNTASPGDSKVEIAYNGIHTTYVINVPCAHQYVEITEEATCRKDGSTQAMCSVCGDTYTVEGSIINKKKHTIVIKDAVTATCMTNGVGYTGDRYCTVCGILVEKGTEIRVLQHVYEYLDEARCKCSICNSRNTYTPHTYTSVENDTCIYYTCTKCGYKPDPIQKTSSTKVSHVVVGQSYGLVDRDHEITVYVKIFNNPGITGLNIRVEYDKRLEFVRAEKGEVLKSSGVFEDAHANGVIGIVSADANEATADGNLLKLVFKLPKDARVADKYPISIGCGNEFTDSDAGLLSLITADGYIKAVSHLPGDINSDEVVDMLDTTLLARYMAIQQISDTEEYEKVYNEFISNQNFTFSEFYADVNLDGRVNLPDLVIMLQYLVGKNKQELTSNEFEVILNSNDGSTDKRYIVVKAYDENGNYGVYPSLPTLSRPGYHFEGWYTGFDALDPKTVQVKAGDRVKYNPTFLHQTLYARWSEITTYTVSFNSNGGRGTMSSSEHVFDTEKVLSENKFTKNGYHFVGWNTKSNGSGEWYSDRETVSNLAPKGVFFVTLYAQWEPNSYTIHYDANGGNGTTPSSTHEYDSYEDLSDNAFCRPGYAFVEWNTSPDGSGAFYSNLENVKNLATEEEGSITLYAQWDIITYSVKYNLNGGSYMTDGTYSSSYTVEDLPIISDVIHTTDPTYMVFDGWYEDSSLTIPLSIDTLKTSPHDLDLYAKWTFQKEYTEYTYMSTTPDIADAYVIIDWSKATGTDVAAVRGTGILCVANTVRELTIIGNPDLTYTNFSILLDDFDENQELVLRLENFKFTTNVDGAIKTNGTDNGMILTIDVHGDCSINTTVAGGSIIKGFTNTLNITGDGEMTLTGGEGSAASAGSPGEDGGDALVCRTLTVNDCLTLNLVGGNGGSSADYTWIPSSSRDGYSGGKGGDGGIGLSCTTIIVNDNVSLSIAGGSGGNGGKGQAGRNKLWGSKNAGGNGGAGGAGAHAIIVTNATISSNANVEAIGGNGGNGGNGGERDTNFANGTRGSGGSGGAGAVAIANDIFIENIIVTNGSDGSAGDTGGSYDSD